MGTPEFAVPALDILVQNNYDVVAVVTSTDSYGGRGGKQLIESAIKKYALEQHIPVLQPTNLKSPAFIEQLKSFEADLQVVVAFRMLPEVVWNMPPLGTFNLHGSLLPKYRGAAPINHAIIQGETETGVTSFKLKHEIDTGDVLLRKKVAIDENDDAGTLHDRMMIIGADVVLETVKLIESGKFTFTKQEDAESTKAPKIFHETCKIDFKKPVDQVYNFIRGLSPYPGAWCVLEGKEIKILKTKKRMFIDDYEAGTIVTDHKKSLEIKCKDGYIQVISLKPQGKKEMSVIDFLNGNKIVATSII
ncbi:MAG: methionyl-tRNA formyltransferase [Saprospiraceae bacterium]|jgi:methionyl-tRNA formyltransferase|nr:methionyl-tRNA formyltransferase [Saprospiraceae bacterium]MBP6566590.1 methionyl-tRNA formyltransferase [Saprospiraceae bacterium]